MAESQNLTGLGVTPLLATAVGWRIVNVTATGTTQVANTVVTDAGENVAVNLTTGPGATSFLLPATAVVGDMVWINVISATPALVFPPSGQQIANKATNLNATVALGAVVIKTTASVWAITGGAT